MFGLTRLEDALQSREGDGSPAAAIYYVLNKFDSSLALHRDIKASLEGRLGERLAPVTIRRSDAVAEALADGMTVIDYCPDAGVAEDFQRLADWIRRMAPVGHVHQDESR
jgi:cellulose biosynthesis protein BcsQ